MQAAGPSGLSFHWLLTVPFPQATLLWTPELDQCLAVHASREPVDDSHSKTSAAVPRTGRQATASAVPSPRPQPSPGRAGPGWHLGALLLQREGHMAGLGWGGKAASLSTPVFVLTMSTLRVTTLAPLPQGGSRDVTVALPGITGC